ncbi:hypothetical protein HPB50_020363 [Hyalomma asiaticum]|uniref:Uncharacterized protein n=1 Tax=Hyalomma asiaticum TaxID=266040 RepID=A0ACB7SVF8_HYAAI|nr:hypothetical protein HPB50_020363 [Hyalomma asiaticum]
MFVRPRSSIGRYRFSDLIRVDHFRGDASEVDGFLVYLSPRRWNGDGIERGFFSSIIQEDGAASSEGQLTPYKVVNSQTDAPVTAGRNFRPVSTARLSRLTPGRFATRPGRGDDGVSRVLVVVVVVVSRRTEGKESCRGRDTRHRANRPTRPSRRPTRVMNDFTRARGTLRRRHQTPFFSLHHHTHRPFSATLTPPLSLAVPPPRRGGAAAFRESCRRRPYVRGGGGKKARSVQSTLGHRSAVAAAAPRRPTSPTSE